MERLSGLDASFLHMETPTMHTHVVGVLVLDTSDMPDGYSFERVRDLIERRMHLIPPFRRRLVPVPLNLDHPVWIEDPDFDLDTHLYRIGAPPPGGMRELAEITADIAGRPLDRSRPLWEMWVIEGLADDRVALVTKIHHSAIDGVSGADIMANLFDLERDAPGPPPPDDDDAWKPDDVPSGWTLIRDGLTHRATHPGEIVRAAGNVGNSLVKTVQTGVSQQRGDGRRPVFFDAPRTHWTGALTSHRSIAFGQASLDDFKAVKSAFGTTVNDVVLAVCANALRRYMLDHGYLPDKQLISYCPVSTHGSGGEGANQVTVMAVRLPTDLEDPVEQLRAIHDETKSAKELTDAVGATALQDVVQFVPPVVFNRAMRLYCSMHLADRHPAVQNVLISNVPGPPLPLYCMGARVAAIYPFGPLIEGCGMNITVLSNTGNVDVGVIACTESVPDVWAVTDRIADALNELVEAAAGEPPLL